MLTNLNLNKILEEQNQTFLFIYFLFFFLFIIIFFYFLFFNIWNLLSNWKPDIFKEEQRLTAVDTEDKNFILKGRTRDKEDLTISLEKVRNFPYFTASMAERGKVTLLYKLKTSWFSLSVILEEKKLNG